MIQFTGKFDRDNAGKTATVKIHRKKTKKHCWSLAFHLANDRIGANWCDCCRNGKVLTDVVGRLSEMPVGASHRQVDEEADVVKHLGMVDHVGFFVFQFGAKALWTRRGVPDHS